MVCNAPLFSTKVLRHMWDQVNPHTHTHARARAHTHTRSWMRDPLR